MIHTAIASPLGDLLAVREDRDADGHPGGLTGLYLPTGRHATALRPEWRRDDHAFDDVRGQLDEYLSGPAPVRPAAAGGWHRVPAPGVDRAGGDPLRRDHHLWPDARGAPMEAAVRP